MKKTLFWFFVFISCACATAQAQEKICRLGEDPVDPTRLVDWTSECISRPVAPQLVLMSTGSGKPVKCILPRLTPVVVDKSTGVARWVLGCGNQILQPTTWVPEGARECAPELAPARTQEIKISPSTTVKVEGETTHRVEVSGEIRHVHSGEVILKQERAPVSELPPAPKKSWWQKNRKWVIPLAVLGVAAGGYAAAKRSDSSAQSQIVYYQPLPPPIKR